MLTQKHVLPYVFTWSDIQILYMIHDLYKISPGFSGINFPWSTEEPASGYQWITSQGMEQVKVALVVVDIPVWGMA